VHDDDTGRDRSPSGPDAPVAPWPAGLAPPVEVDPLPGGFVGTTARARLADGQTVVVKRTPYPADAEVDGLVALAAAGVPVPAVVGWVAGTLVLEAVGGGLPPPDGDDWAALGRAVAGMHAVSFERFGWHRDNRAGRCHQPNPWTDDWREFYVEHRVRSHLDDPSLPEELRSRLARACDGPIGERLPSRPQPVLTHGDLWLGNTVAGRWVVDPEVSAADRELDLAYMQLSVRMPFPAAFWGAYREVSPFPDGYEERRPILELHHRLLQVRHFGDSQLAPLADLLAGQGW
jgi:fructosamine-3-kinase